MGKKKSGKDLSAEDKEWLKEELAFESQQIPPKIDTSAITLTFAEVENLYPANTAKDKTLLNRQANNKRPVEQIFNTDKQLDMVVFDFSMSETYKSLNDYFDAQKEDYEYKPRRFTGKFDTYSRKEKNLRYALEMLGFVHAEEFEKLDVSEMNQYELADLVEKRGLNIDLNEQSTIKKKRAAVAQAIEAESKDKGWNKKKKEKPQPVLEERPSHRRKNMLDHVRSALTVYKKTPDYVPYKNEKPAVVIMPCDDTESGIWISVMPKSLAKEKFEKFQKLMELPVYNPERAMVHTDPASFYAENKVLVAAVSEEDKMKMYENLLPEIQEGREIALMVEMRDNARGFELVAYDKDEVEYVHAKRAKQYWNNRQKTQQDSKLVAA